MKKRLKFIVKISILIFLAILLFVSSLILFLKSGNNIIRKSLSFSEDGSINYRVFLKDNDFFDVDYFDKNDLEKKNQTIISKFIDNINIAFTYNISFNNKIDAKYFYQIKGTLIANNSDGTKNYWSKEYDLTNKKEISITNKSSYTIAENINVNYDTYNDLYNNFKAENTALSSDGLLKIELLISSENTSEEFDKTLKFNPVLAFEIPLSKASTEVNIKSLDMKNSNSYTVEEKDNKLIYKVRLIFSIILILIFLYLAFRIMYLIRKYITKNFYAIKLKRILNTYNGIIVNINTLPTLEDYDLIRVESFDELINAHGEVRLPINYYSENGNDIFLLINGNIAWYFDFKAYMGDL